METQNIQATITLTLTQAQLLSLLTPNLGAVQQTASAVPAAPAATSPTAQTAAPVIPGALPSAPAQPSSMAKAQSPMPAPAQQIPAAQTPAAQTPPMPAQTAQQTYTVEQLGLAARPLVESGRREELVALLTEFGVPSVAAIPEDRRADFAARLRALGGQI